jgi:hypothetical protein
VISGGSAVSLDKRASLSIPRNFGTFPPGSSLFRHLLLGTANYPDPGSSLPNPKLQPLQDPSPACVASGILPALFQSWSRTTGSPAA